MKKVLSLLLVVFLLMCNVTLVSCDSILNKEIPSTDDVGDTNTPPCKHDDPTKVVVLPAVPSTCTETGLTEGLKCTLCGTSVIPQAVVSKIEHQLGDWATNVSEDAIKEIRECSLCREIGDRRNVAFDVNESVTISFYVRRNNLNYLWDKYISQFNELYPNIRIEVRTFEYYSDLSGNTAGNIALCYPENVAKFNALGNVITLDQFINSSIEITRADGSVETLGLTQSQVDDFIDGFFNEGKQFGDDLMYTLPFSRQAELLYYNKTFFEENNLEVPTTWDEMEALCARIKEIDPDCIPLGYESASNLFITLCEQFGSPYTSSVGEHYLFDNDTNRAFVKKMAEWFEKGYITTMYMYGAYLSSPFTAQNMYMCITNSRSAINMHPRKDTDGNYLFEVDIARVPQVDPANSKVYSEALSLVMLNRGGTKEAVATWLFMKFLTTNAQVQADYSKEWNYTPVIESAMYVDSYADYLNGADGGNNLAALALKMSLEQRDAYFSIPAFVGSQSAKERVGYLLKSYGNSANIDSMIADAFKQALQDCKK